MSQCKPVLQTLSKASRARLLPYSQTRHESTTRRHKKLLHVKEAPSYTPDRPTPTLVFNPPSSAPNVYHTPLKFLPRDDSRKKLYEAALSYSTASSLRRQTSPVAAPGTPLTSPSHLPPKPSAHLPAALRQPYEKQYHLTDKDIAEIRKLRKQDPEKWTRVKLAEKFGCSQFFVGMVAKNEEKAERVEKAHEEARARWGARRRMAREDRGRRKELWGRDA